MTFDELVSIWDGSANWWLKAEGDIDYFYKGFVTDMTVPIFLKIRDCEVVNIAEYDLMRELEDQKNACIDIENTGGAWLLG